ncbi:hypothetical protein [Actibacterium sp. MT2.3-13A]|uniref:hypothetical protein n=1 Tax=Actibacterium sp. MT2.3-13A TaxID=2828332 RepID=UPI001BAB8C28|nr:hypothetical protein [Actibacterium sp. MT2.3-13A]
MKQIVWAIVPASLIGFAMTAGGVAADHKYPEVTRMQTAPIGRPCTQLELTAGVDRAQCGSLTVGGVIQQLLSEQDD